MLGKSPVLVMLIAGLSYAQAVAPMVEPVIEPAPTPTDWRDGSAAPVGAGLVTPNTPMGEPLDAPRSPNRRLLPASGEPGLWAADEVRAVDRPNEQLVDVGGIWLNVPKNRRIEGPSECARTLNKAIISPSDSPLIVTLPQARQQCFALDLLVYCTGRRLDQARNSRGESGDIATNRQAKWTDASSAAVAMYDAQCKAFKMSEKEIGVRETILREWHRRIRPFKRNP